MKKEILLIGAMILLVGILGFMTFGNFKSTGEAVHDHTDGHHDKTGFHFGEDHVNDGHHGEPKEFDLVVTNWKFTPSEIRVKEGDLVRFNLDVKEGNHGFAIFEFGISKYLQEGKITTVEFVAEEKGEYYFFCNTICGEGHEGMEGKLIVE